jgi:cyclohexyl-isocyanide hydratase
MLPTDTHLEIGSLVFEGMDQIDLTGPFEVLSRIPNSTYRLYGVDARGVCDVKGLRLMPDADLDAAPHLDVLHVPGGHGQEALMEDEAVLGWIRRQAGDARAVFSVCTGALLLGAAGLLIRRRATTHWASFHLLPLFGAIPVNERVVVDGSWVFAVAWRVAVPCTAVLAMPCASPASRCTDGCRLPTSDSAPNRSSPRPWRG